MFLKLSTILTYLDASNTSRCFIEGLAVLEADHIVLCGIRDVLENKNKIVAYCLQSSGVKSDPHEIIGFLIIVEECVQIENFQCSCKAGSSGCCKHVSATLLYCARVPVEDFRMLSSTDLKCEWKARKPKVEGQYVARALNSTKCFEPQMTSAQTSAGIPQDLRNHLHETILKRLPDCTVNLHNTGRRPANCSSIRESKETPAYVLELIKNANESQLLNSLNINVEIENDCCFSVYCALEEDDAVESACCKQGSSLWGCKRQHRITGTSCYAIYTYKGADWNKKSNSVFVPNKYISKEMKFGNEQEVHAFEKFQANNPKYAVERIGFFINKKISWLGCSPDGVIFENSKPTRLLEIKCPYAGKCQSAADVLPTIKYLETDHTLKKHHKYYAPIQFSMALLNLNICDFIVYFASEETYLQITVELDRSFTKQLLETVTHNYFDKMLHNICLIEKGNDSDNEEVE